jgi:signal transduction histidine kinase
MTDKICFLACENIWPELKSVIDAEKLEDVESVVFPALCRSSRTAEKAVKDLVIKNQERFDKVTILGGDCLASLGRKYPEMAVHRNPQNAQCFYLFQSQNFVDAYLNQNCYLMMPGWLPNWKKHRSLWGFDKSTAREFFKETVSKIVVLDSGIKTLDSQRLQEIGEFTGIPVEVVSIGTDYFRLVLMNIILEWRCERAKAASNSCAQETADYGMALDLIGTLTQTTVEKEVIQGILDLSRVLFAPATQAFLKMEDGAVQDIYFQSDKPFDLEAAQKRLSAFPSEFAWTESGNGFIVRFGEEDNMLGVLEVDGLAFPQYKDRYLNLTVALSKVCALAIQSAHNHERLQQRTRELENTNKELEAFSYSVSHDLKAPLRSISGFSTAIFEDYGDQLDETGKDFLDRVRQASQLMSMLIDDILRLSRVGRAEIQYTSINLSDLVHSVAKELRDSQPERQAEFKIAPDIIVEGDLRLLKIALTNLLENAWKFTSQRPETTIEFGITSQDGRRVYFVKDNGTGFDMQNADRLFQPFQRLHSQKDYEGTGIGLAIVQRIIRRHGGEVWAESGIDGGAIFYFNLNRKLM